MNRIIYLALSLFFACACSSIIDAFPGDTNTVVFENSSDSDIILMYNFCSEEGEFHHITYGTRIVVAKGKKAFLMWNQKCKTLKDYSFSQLFNNPENDGHELFVYCFPADLTDETIIRWSRNEAMAEDNFFNESNWRIAQEEMQYGLSHVVNSTWFFEFYGFE